VANAAFSVNLQEIDLPDDVRRQIESTLRSVVLARIAKTDLGAQLSVQPHPSERDFFRPGQILGFVIKNVAKLAERDSVMTGPSLLFTPPDQVKQAQALLASAVRKRKQKPSTEAEQLERIAALLERDPEARRAFSRLLEGDATDEERDDSVFKYGLGAAPFVYAFRLGAKIGQSLVK
jgi:hypothetical protein